MQEWLLERAERFDAWQGRLAPELRRLSERVDLLGRFADTLLRLPAGLPAEEVAHILETARRTLTDAFVPDFDAREAATEAAHERLEELDEVFDSRAPTDAEADEVDRLNDLVLAHHDDSDIQLVRDLNGTCVELAAKAAKVASYAADRKALLAALANRHYPLRDAQIRTADTDAFSITLHVDARAKDFPDGSPDAAGVHLGGSPLNLVFAGARDPEATARHERMHNLMDGSAHLSHGMPSKAVRARLEKNVADLAGDPGDPLAFRAAHEIRHTFGEPARWARQMLDRVHNELRAEFENHEAAILGTRPRPPSGAELFGARTSSIMDGGPWFSTAEREMHRLRDLLNQTARQKSFATHEETADLPPLLLRAAEAVEETFVAFKARLAGTVRVADLLGGRARTDLHLLTFLLRPSRWSTILLILAYRHGRERTARLAAADRALAANAASTADLETIVAALADEPENAALRTRAAAYVRHLENGPFDALDGAVKGLGRRAFAEYGRALRRLHALAPDAELDHTLSRFAFMYFSRVSERDFPKGAERIAEEYLGAAPDARDSFLNALEEALGHLATEAAACRRIEARYGADPARWPQWERLEAAGVPAAATGRARKEFAISLKELGLA